MQKEKIRQLLRARLLSIITLLLAAGSVCQAQDDQGSWVDFEAGYRFQTLSADKIPEAYVKTAGVNVATLALKPGSRLWLPLRLEYHFTPGNSADQKEVIAAERSASGDAAIKRLMAGIDIPVPFDWGAIFFDYEKSAFLYGVQSKRDYWYVSNEPARLLLPGDQVSVLTTVELRQFGWWSKGRRSEGGVGLGMYRLNYERPFLSTVVAGTPTLYEADFSSNGAFIKLSSSDRPEDEWFGTFEYLASISHSDVTLVDGVTVSAATEGSDIYEASFKGLAAEVGYRRKIFGAAATVILGGRRHQFEGYEYKISTDDTFYLGVSVRY